MAEVTPSGSGGPIQLTGPAADGFLEIRGGVGGISFQLEELISGAEKLDAAAGELAGVEVEVRRIWEDLCLYQEEARPTGTTALMGVGEAQWSVQAVRVELQRISQQVRDCKWDYETAEAWAGFSRGIGGGLTSAETLGRQAGDLGLGFVPNREVAELATGPLAMLALLAVAPERFLVALGADIVAGRHVAAAVPMLNGAAGSSLRILQPRPVTADRKETLPIEFDGSPAALLARAQIIDERGEGYIEVVEVDNGGQKAYVVVIPGTQTGGEMGGVNPFDEAGIVEGLGHNSAEINAAVLRALQDAGAEKGAPVVAVGYSQGGIHAMNLAADELFLNEYDMKYVLTAGSPVGGIVPDADVTALHLEHRQDWVPGTDGTPNPDARNRVTVTLNSPVTTPEGGEFGIGPGHRLSNYTGGARLVAESDDPSLTASTAVLAGVLGAGGTATATRFALTRAKPPEALPRLKPDPPPRASQIGRAR
ncbi:hypothetical protein GU243_16460 [Pseudarthrobacter psychrotolerans]|uniref:PE-PPE domain-containing protein n=1 Tax=Pseudarthrobacter psychrotolerans TaxID=2697569 RepID=A0A6P1NP87_9MICC|nr:hypothetical protein [Pseudarthrobacter psychrotolerans]QHK21038.1 hypothetical protein GU243_16460 [Pseudarthrobacter psychrotolerans]